MFKSDVIKHVYKESRKQRTLRNLLFIIPFIYLCAYNNRAQEAGTLIFKSYFNMTYSKRVTELQRIYSLTPEDVFFCMLVASGATRQEAYAAIYRPTTNGTGTIASKANALQKNKPGISQLIEAIQYQRSGGTTPTKTGSPKEDTAQIAEGNKVDKKTLDTFRSKDGILEGLIKVLPSVTGKDKAAVLIQIADLQRMKQEENKEEAEQVVYYHPVSCFRCALYAEHKKKQKEEARKDADI